MLTVKEIVIFNGEVVITKICKMDRHTYNYLCANAPKSIIYEVLNV